MTTIPDLELISFDLCPFVQRSVITLLHKGVDHRITYIDLADKPDWFVAISPLGKVPVIRIDRDTVLFESAVINEYLDEITPPSLHPADPIDKARNRAWIEVGSTQITNQYNLFMAQDRAQFDEKLTPYLKGFDRIERILTGPFFNGTAFSLVDAAWAPIFTQHAVIDRILGQDLLAGHPNVAAWAGTLSGMEAVETSVKPDYDDLKRAQLKRRGSYLSTVSA